MYLEIRIKRFDVMLRRITLDGVSIMTDATHVCILCMRYCNGITAYILLHYVMKFYLEKTKAKEMTTFLYVLFDHPTYYIPLNPILCSETGVYMDIFY